MTKEQKAKLQDEFPNITFHRDGSVTVRRAYFYRTGNVEKFEAFVKKQVPDAEIVKSWDDFAAWPKTSYFHVTFRIAPITGAPFKSPAEKAPA